MSDKFDRLAKSVAESVTRRQALRRFAGGLVGMALAGFALSSKAAPPASRPGFSAHLTTRTATATSVAAARISARSRRTRVGSAFAIRLANLL
jgi:hypothetical protein